MINDLDPDRLSILLDVASGRAAVAADLTDVERQELERLHALLDAIDMSWNAPDAQRDRVRELFLTQLAARTPNHPWVRSSTIQTLGELIRAGAGDAPGLPAVALSQLASDPTPVVSLLDPQQRTALVGQAVRRANIPTNLIGTFMLWLNRQITYLVRSPDPAAQGLLFTRRQAKRGPADDAK